MNKKLSSYFVQLTQNACLKSFWRKRALRTFLKQHGISENALATWAGDERKQDFLSRLFDKLIARKDNRGHAIILDMARSLAEQEHFPDLENWEDTPLKLKVARESVARLRKDLSKLDQQQENVADTERRKAAAERRREKSIASQQTLEKLKSQLDELATRIGTQEAGYEFEMWFYDLVDYFEIECKRPYKVGGRQIDGSITLDGTTFLVELKFTKEQAGAQDIDVFRRKVTSKADNTMGVCVSMSGFTSIAIQEASGERTPLLLLDFQHLYFVLSSVMTLPEVVNRVKRNAAQTAAAYLAITGFSK